MRNRTVFGNLKYNKKLEIGDGCGIKLLANIGHMDMDSSFEDELKKAEIAVKYDVDILADNTITCKSFYHKSVCTKPFLLSHYTQNSIVCIVSVKLKFPAL